jgi:hypothetical protein
MSLDKRVAALESKSSPAEWLTVWITKLARPGGGRFAERELTGYKTPDGQRWDRHEGESVTQVRERAVAEVPRGARGWGVLIEDYAVEHSQRMDERVAPRLERAKDER